MLTLGQIDWLNPFNAEAPLNQGVLAWWRAGDGPYWGNNRYLDLVPASGRALNTHLPLQNNPTWVGALGRAAYGSLRCNTSEGGAQITCPAYLRLSFPIHISFWMKSIGTPSAYADMAGVTYTNSDTNPYLSYSIGCTSGGNLTGRGNNGTGVWEVATSTPVSSLTDWTHLAFEMVSGGAGYLYRNGIQVASGSPFGSGPTYDANAKLFIGTSTPGTARNVNCDIDDVRIASRQYGDKGVYDLWQASKAGWPNEFNRMRRNFWPTVEEVVGGGAGTNLHLLQNQSALWLPSWHAQRLC